MWNTTTTRELSVLLRLVHFHRRNILIRKVLVNTPFLQHSLRWNLNTLVSMLPLLLVSSVGGGLLNYLLGVIIRCSYYLGMADYALFYRPGNPHINFQEECLLRNWRSNSIAGSSSKSWVVERARKEFNIIYWPPTACHGCPSRTSITTLGGLEADNKDQDRIQLNNYRFNSFLLAFLSLPLPLTPFYTTTDHSCVINAVLMTTVKNNYR